MVFCTASDGCGCVELGRKLCALWKLLFEQADSLQNEHHSKQAAPNLQHTTNWEQDDRCSNSTTQSQAPDDGYINVRNMLST